jgi:hypothetical protein
MRTHRTAREDTGSRIFPTGTRFPAFSTTPRCANCGRLPPEPNLEPKGENSRLSGPLAKSPEMDVLPILPTGSDPQLQQEAADILNGNIGEGTPFLGTHGFEVEGVVEIDLTLPKGWRDRTKAVCNENTNGCIGHCLDPYDMATAKLVAGREKDRMALVNLIRQAILKPEKLRDRVRMLEDPQIPDGSSVDDLVARLGRWVKLALPNPPTI